MLIANNGLEKKQKKIFSIQGGFPALSATFILDQITGLIDRGYSVLNLPTYDPNEARRHAAIDQYNLMQDTIYIKTPPEVLKQDYKLWNESFTSLNPGINLDECGAFHVHYGKLFNDFLPLFKQTDKFVLVSFYGYDASSYIQQHGHGIYRELFDRADLITTNTHTMKNVLVREGCLPEKITVHRCGIALDHLKVPERDQNNKKVTILTAARMVEKKGIHDTLVALAAMPNKEVFEYRLMGHGPLLETYRNMVKQLNLDEIVTFLGGQPREVLYEEMKNADFFVLTSATASNGDQEGLPVVLSEAMAFGLPVVSTYHAGIPELVEHGVSGLLANEHDIEKIAINIHQMIHNKDLRIIMGQNARKKVEEEFEINKLNDKLAGYFEYSIIK